MPTNADADRSVDPRIWRHPEIRAALARRDIGSVYRALTARGFSQRQIAALTGQVQSDVHAIRNGRQVVAYDLLVRIADGLGIPRGYLGIGYDRETASLVGTAAERATVTPELTASELIGHAAKVTMGAAQFDPAHWIVPLAAERTPGRSQIGAADVEQLEHITSALRALDASSGGGSCRDAVLAQVKWAQSALLGARCSDNVLRRLHVSIADLHNLAGWVSFDVGLYRSATKHYLRALEQAEYAGDASLVANIVYRMGRLHLHLADTAEQAERMTHGRNALRLFQLGQIAAQESGCGITVSMLCANEATAYAVLGEERQTLRSLARAADEFHRAEPATSAGWIRFFGAADLAATAGVARATLGGHQIHRQGAVDALTESVGARDRSSARSETFELAVLARVHLIEGDTREGVLLGHKAVHLAEGLRSTRVIDRMAPLRRAATNIGGSDCEDLAERIAALAAA